MTSWKYCLATSSTLTGEQADIVLHAVIIYYCGLSPLNKTWLSCLGVEVHILIPFPYKCIPVSDILKIGYTFESTHCIAWHLLSMLTNCEVKSILLPQQINLLYLFSRIFKKHWLFLQWIVIIYFTWEKLPELGRPYLLLCNLFEKKTKNKTCQSKIVTAQHNTRNTMLTEFC